MRLLFISGVLAALLFVGSPANADSGSTLQAEIKPVIRGGTLQGCAINFEVVRQDVEYSKGDWVYISGSLNFWAFPGKPLSFALKLGVKPLQVGGDFQAPAEAYFLNGYTTNAGERFTQFEGETPGFRLFGFKLGDEAMKAIERVAEDGQLKIGYAMRPGGMAAPLNVDLRMKQLNLEEPSKSQVDAEAPLKWFDCMKEAATISMGKR